MKKGLILGALLLTGVAVASAQSKKEPEGPVPLTPEPGTTPGPTSGEAAPDVFIEDHDQAWNYKREGGRWYTMRKGQAGGRWVDMEANLSPEYYSLAISRLTAHLASKGLSGFNAGIQNLL